MSNDNYVFIYKNNKKISHEKTIKYKITITDDVANYILGDFIFSLWLYTVKKCRNEFVKDSEGNI